MTKKEHAEVIAAMAISAMGHMQVENVDLEKNEEADMLKKFCLHVLCFLEKRVGISIAESVEKLTKSTNE